MKQKPVQLIVLNLSFRQQPLQFLLRQLLVQVNVQDGVLENDFVEDSSLEKCGRKERCIHAVEHAAPLACELVQVLACLPAIFAQHGVP